MTSVHVDPDPFTDVLDRAISEGAEALFRAQRPDGVFDYSEDNLTSTLGTVGALSALHYADPEGSADLIEAGAGWLRRTQNEDGGWAMVPGLPSEAGPTAVSSAVLHLVDPVGSAAHVESGQRWMGDHGGLEAIPHPEVVSWCRQYYGFVGWLAPEDMRRFPLELALLPGLYRRLFDLRVPMASALGLAQAKHKPLNPLQRLFARLGTPNALTAIRQVYEHEGSTGAWCENAWVTGLVCTGLARADLAPDMVAAAVGWFRRTMDPDGWWQTGPLDAAWTMYAVRGLTEVGYADDPRLVASRDLFTRLQQHRPFLAFGCPPGYWGWAGTEGWPSTLETGEILSVLCRLPGDEQAHSVERGVDWLTRVQDTRGSWGLCVKNTKVANSGPCPMTTVQAVDALLDAGVPATDPRVRRALTWLGKAQLPDGSFESVWYRQHTMGTAAVLETFSRVGRADDPVARKAVAWLERARLDDGSWGDGAGAPGTVEETGWAVSALLASGADAAGLRTGVDWLLAHRADGGGWPSEIVHEYVRHVSRYTNPAFAQGMALRALGRYRDAVAKP
ncbi:prenyltransferase/squalene oxidase repeat-containing protein [Actinosynnema mirum]|uniref:Prenyltransferase/squalene oxidase n=1 Tax=Actinosynnema mirum (strain ATCC 29888 / DSM 43827 / JCM 3225 / NBRC 14064 / NCIMB 13271 / NRRL B-12336 / IMRU 3971 / 101) TaxID=446462 RepID=C6WK21_ACTMD|nr:prenyltransferase/squalene oxidase repeat-containing protein [Actinosynnema mirum]ACU38234.1 Prenyltransferase/squalene oxidase [Actinosynnema mirum DSM 43827]